MGAFIDLTGCKFGRLTTIDWFRICHPDKRRGTRIIYRCQCDCGKTCQVAAYHLKAGHQVSCGCYNDEKKRKHGLYRLREYHIWADMKARCNNPRHRSFSRYGGRGIKVCKRWQKSFVAFLEDVGRRPSPRHSLDRFPNNNGDYKPGNVRWATQSQQMCNTRMCRFLTYEGVTLTVAEWARRINVSEMTLRGRLRAGWTDEEAVTWPVLSRSESRGNKRRREAAR